MKYPLLNCEGDFLLVEKIADKWYFKVLLKDSRIKGGSPYELIYTDPLEILFYLKGDLELNHYDYETLNYLDYSDDYKNFKKVSSLVGDLIMELHEGYVNDTLNFLKQFNITLRKND